MILLTGANGKTGSVAAKALAGKGLKIRALVRNEEKAKGLKDAGIEVVVGDVADDAILSRALTDVSKALITLPNGEQQLANEKRIVDHAKKAGVKHIVKMSSMEAIPGTKNPVPAIHVESEAYIRASGMAWTMIRPNFFMQNFFSNAATIKSMGKFFMPCGKGTTGMSDARDVGAIVAAVLSGTGHENQTYEITGPQLLTFEQAAGIFSEALGRKIEYVDQPMAEYRANLGKFLTNAWHLNAVCELIGEIAHGGLDRVTDTTKRILGREPIALTQFVADHIVVFK